MQGAPARQGSLLSSPGNAAIAFERPAEPVNRGVTDHYAHRVAASSRMHFHCELCRVVDRMGESHCGT
ncbi:MAG: hypothetical protein V7642_4440 [Burkholderiales bacterium]|jgi:hypothetical protein